MSLGWQWVNISSSCTACKWDGGGGGGGGGVKNACELLNLGVLKFSTLHKIIIFQCMGKIFCVENYLTHTLKYLIFLYKNETLRVWHLCWTFLRMSMILDMINMANHILWDMAALQYFVKIVEIGLLVKTKYGYYVSCITIHISETYCPQCLS